MCFNALLSVGWSVRLLSSKLLCITLSFVCQRYPFFSLRYFRLRKMKYTKPYIMWMRAWFQHVIAHTNTNTYIYIWRILTPFGDRQIFFWLLICLLTIFSDTVYSCCFFFNWAHHFNALPTPAPTPPFPQKGSIWKSFAGFYSTVYFKMLHVYTSPKQKQP